jgi:hypothetical protein
MAFESPQFRYRSDSMQDLSPTYAFRVVRQVYLCYWNLLRARSFSTSDAMRA